MRMRPAIAALLIFACSGTAATAQDYPWCVEMDPFTKNCSFASQQECIATAKSVSAICVRNAQYQPPPAPSPRKPVRRPN